MKILVTGSKGTLGKPLVEELKKSGYTVCGCDLTHDPNREYSRCDIGQYRQLREFLIGQKFDLIYNLAAEFGRVSGEENYEKVWMTNVVGMRNILELQKELKFKLIQASSSEIYGDIPVKYLKEDTPPVPQYNEYAISKWVNEIQCRNFREKFDSQIMVLRFSNAYGPGEYYTPYRSVVCLFCYRALHDLPYTVYTGYFRTFMYIDDFIPTLARCTEKFMPGEVINIGGREYRSVQELSEIILRELGKKDVKITYLTEDKHNVLSKYLDIEKATKLLNHHPVIPLEVGIKKTIAWMKEVYKK